VRGSFFARVLRNAGLFEGVVGSGVDVLVVEDEIVLRFLLEANLLTAGEDLVTAISSYHLVRVEVMCIFSMMLRQPTPVL